MTSRERVRKALNHEQSDRIPIDLGAHCCSGIHEIEYNELVKKLGLAPRLPKNLDAFMHIAEIEDDVRDAMDVDLIGIYTKGTTLGYRRENLKPWKLPDGTEILIGGDFECSYDEKGNCYAYPQGDRSVAPSAFMTTTGYYFDLLNRQENLDEKTEWNAREDYKDDWSEISEEDLKDIQQQAEYYYENTDKSLFGNYWQAGLGDNILFAAPWLKEAKGIRHLEDWFIALMTEKDYINDIYEMQTEYSLKNMALWYEAVGNKIDVMGITGTDFGSQHGLLLSRDIYREMYMPYYKRLCDWIHENTEWKVLMHTCGAVRDILPDIIETGFDCINPVQCSAAGMEAEGLKKEFGKDIVFWGGGCNPQGVLIHGTAEQCYEETKKNAEILGKNGGLIGSNVHNLQYGVPIENYLAVMQAFKDVRF